jgi:hypothetical protein
MVSRAEGDPLLALIQAGYGRRWRIRRTAHLWIATARDRDADHAPTIVEPCPEALVRQLEDPPPRAGAHQRSLLQAPWVTAQMERLGTGAYWVSGLPSV